MLIILRQGLTHLSYSRILKEEIQLDCFYFLISAAHTSILFHLALTFYFSDLFAKFQTPLMKHRLALAFGIENYYRSNRVFQPTLRVFPTQAPSPSLCCRGKLCSEMSTTSTRTCPSGRLTYIMLVPSYLFCQNYMACTLITFFFISVCYRIQDGLLIFRWWKMYNPKQKQHGQ